MSQLKYILPTVITILLLSGITLFIQEIRRGGKPDEMPARLSTALNPQQLEAIDYIKGKALFADNCKKCHNFLALDQGFFIRGIKNEFWTGPDKIASFLQQPDRFVNEPYIIAIKQKFGQGIPHLQFRLSNDEVRMIYRYIMIESEKAGL